MNRNNKRIAEITLKILSKKSWNTITLDEIKKKSKIKSFDSLIKNKTDLLKKINNYFDYQFSLKSKNLDSSNYKDMIFEILMIRFDILQNHRKGVISIFKSFKTKPKELFFLLPNILDSILLMMKHTKIPVQGIIGQIKIKGIFFIYITSFFVWLKDETSSLEKTMTAVDQYLNQADNIVKFIK